MEATGRFVLGGVIALIGLLGLGLAAGHEEGGFHTIGLLIFVLSVVLLFAQIADVAHSKGSSGLPLRPILRSFSRNRERGYEVLRTMGAIEKFGFGGLIALFAIIALFAAARHGEGGSYWAGLGVFGICIGLIFYLIAGVKHGSGNDNAH